MIFTLFLGILAVLSMGITLWRWLEGWNYPLRQLLPQPQVMPPVTVFKPLKGCDLHTARCLETWLQQQYPGRIQILFGVASEADPVCEVVRQLVLKYPACDARLEICSQRLGANGKMSTLAQLASFARSDIYILSDADVAVAHNLLAQAVSRLLTPGVGLVNCLYRFAAPTTLSMRLEAVAVNADFWSQVLQDQRLQPLDFALGAVIAVPRQRIEAMGGFAVLVDYLADDYQLGHRIAQQGAQVVLSPMVVDCWSASANWQAVWRHQLRWARTIRCCKPLPYGLSLIANATLWPLLWVTLSPSRFSVVAAASSLILRMVSAVHLQWRLTQSWSHGRYFWLAPLNDVLQFVIWLGAFGGNTIEWRGERFRVEKNGRLSALG